MAQSMPSDYIQILTYIARKPSLTREQFYHYWETVHGPKVAPWAEKHGIKQYQQIHASGTIIPSQSSSSAPNASRDGDLPAEPVPFDGIAMFLVPSLERFTEAFSDPYYVEVIEPDECQLIDKDGVGNGVIASFQGRMVGVLEEGKTKEWARHDEYWRVFEEFERKKKD